MDQQPFRRPNTPGHQPRSIPLQVDVLADGRFRLSTPVARGWAAVASDPRQLFSAMRDAFTEVAVASYARAKREPYDLDQLTGHVPGDPLAGSRQSRVPGARPAGRRKSYNPADWTKLSDQSGAEAVWQSPSGRRYREDTKVVRSVLTRRAALGLET